MMRVCLVDLFLPCRALELVRRRNSTFDGPRSFRDSRNRDFVTIPKPLREKLGIRPGTRLDFQEGGKLLAVKVSGEDPVERVFGCLGRGLKTDMTIRSLRGRP